MRFRATIILLGFAGIMMVLLATVPTGLSEQARWVAAIGVLMALLWMTEALPLAATALIPLAFFPAIGISDLENVCRAYAHPVVFMLLGGFFIAAALQRWDLHSRLAWFALQAAGPRPAFQLLAIMTIAALLSMFISNTVTALMLMPIVLAMLPKSLGEGSNAEFPEDHRTVEAAGFGAAMMLGTGYSATIGGMGSLIGTPSNVFFASFVEKTYGVTVGFGQWMLLGLPVVTLLIIVAWIIISQTVSTAASDAVVPGFDQGPRSRLSFAQRSVAVVVAITVIAWVSRPYIAAVFGLPRMSDAGIAITAALALFALPSDKSLSGRLLTWNEVRNIRWDILIIVGGGLALSDAIVKTGLARWIGNSAANLTEFPFIAIVVALMGLIVLFGELASNIAVAAIFLPIAAATAAALGVEPQLLLLPIAFSASLGFMLPVASGPNAVIFASGLVSTKDMLRAGALLNFFSILIVLIVVMTLGPMIFDTNWQARP